MGEMLQILQQIKNTLKLTALTLFHLLFFITILPNEKKYFLRFCAFCFPFFIFPAAWFSSIWLSTEQTWIFPGFTSHYRWSYPIDLLYRKHYISKKGNNVALRLALQLGSSFSANETSENQSLGTNISLHNYHVSVGKERQIPVSKKIQSYFGVDFGAGFSNSSVKPMQDDVNSGFVKSSQDAVNVSSTGFLGFKYHISPNFSIGAETALSVYYSHTSTTRTFESNTDIGTSKSSFDNLGLRMDHIRSVRFAYHF